MFLVHVLAIGPLNSYNFCIWDSNKTKTLMHNLLNHFNIIVTAWDHVVYLSPWSIVTLGVSRCWICLSIVCFQIIMTKVQLTYWKFIYLMSLTFTIRCCHVHSNELETFILPLMSRANEPTITDNFFMINHLCLKTNSMMKTWKEKSLRCNKI
jgi:hypothetical protein